MQKNGIEKPVFLLALLGNADTGLAFLIKKAIFSVSRELRSVVQTIPNSGQKNHFAFAL